LSASIRKGGFFYDIKLTGGHLKIITNNPTLKVISLILAIILWMFVKSKSGGEIGLVVPLEFSRVPQNLIVTKLSEDAVNVRIIGALSQLERLSTKEVRARIDFSRARPGVNTFDILPDNFNIPETLRITQISPSSIKIELDRVIDKVVHVKPVVKGRLARGYRISKITTEPPYITLQGATSQLANMKEVLTEEIDVSGLKETVQVEVPLRVTGIRLKKGVERTVKVTVVIEGR
jgi:YbbR domain-containing protein